VTLFVGIKLQSGKSYLGEHLADVSHLLGGAETVATATLIVAVAREVVRQLIAKLSKIK
jgi:hypothetical protein